MKKIIISLTWILLSYAGHTTILSRDTTAPALPDTSTECLPVTDLRKVYKSAEDGKIFRAERDTAFELIKVMERRLLSKDSTIENLSVSFAAGKDLAANHKKETDNLMKQFDAQRLDMEFFKKQYTRQKTKTALCSLAGIALTVAVLLLK